MKFMDKLQDASTGSSRTRGVPHGAIMAMLILLSLREPEYVESIASPQLPSLNEPLLKNSKTELKKTKTQYIFQFMDTFISFFDFSQLLSKSREKFLPLQAGKMYLFLVQIL